MGFFDKINPSFDSLKSSGGLKRTFGIISKDQLRDASELRQLRGKREAKDFFKQSEKEGNMFASGQSAAALGAFSHLFEKPGRTDAPSAVSSPGTGSETSTRTQEAREQAILEARQRRGMSSTVTTTPLGVTSFAGTSKKKLIGE